MTHCPNGADGQSWARLKQGARSVLSVTFVCGGPEHVSHLPLLSHVNMLPANMPGT